MTTTMSMRERHEKIDELVQHDPRVIACAHRFEAAQADITDWHAHNDALCATKGALNELDELIAYSEWCLEGLKCAKRCAYNQLMSQYPRVWDTSCDDPFDTGTQDNATDAGAETEEMEEVAKLGGNMPVFTISADKFVDLFDQAENFYKARTKLCEDEFSHIDGAISREGLKAVQHLHRQLLRLIDEDKEAKENNNTNCGTFINWNNCPPYLDFDRASKKLLVSLHAEQEVELAAERNSITGKELQKFLARSEEAHKDFVESALEIMYTILLSYPGYHKVAAKLDFGGNNQTDMASETTELGDEAKEPNHA